MSTSFSNHSNEASNSAAEMNVACLPAYLLTLGVIEVVGYLIDEVVGILEETEEAIVDLDADVALVLLETEAAVEEVFHPMITDL